MADKIWPMFVRKFGGIWPIGRVTIIIHDTGVDLTWWHWWFPDREFGGNRLIWYWHRR